MLKRTKYKARWNNLLSVPFETVILINADTTCADVKMGINSAIDDVEAEKTLTVLALVLVFRSILEDSQISGEDKWIMRDIIRRSYSAYFKGIVRDALPWLFGKKKEKTDVAN